MRRVFISAMVAAFCLMGGPIHAQKKTPLIDTRHDRYSDRTTISTAEISPLGNLMLSASVSYTGNRPARFDDIRFLIIGADSFWPTIEQSIIVGFIADDGQPVTYTAGYSSSFLVAGVVSTAYGFDLSMSDLAAIACARSVDMKVGQTELRLKPKHVATLKAMLQTIGGYCPQGRTELPKGRKAR